MVSNLVHRAAPRLAVWSALVLFFCTPVIAQEIDLRLTQVDDSRLIVDIANSLAMESPRSVPVDLGDFRAVVHDDAGGLLGQHLARALGSVVASSGHAQNSGSASSSPSLASG